MPENTEKISRKEREKLAHRLEILEAAERVFAQKGLEHTTVEDVAQEAEFSIGTIYNFFQNKDALYGEVMLKIVDDFDAVFLAETANNSDPLSAIMAVVSLRFSSMEKHGGFFRRIMDAKPISRLSPDHAIPAICRQRYDIFLQNMADLFTKAIENGQIRKIDPFYAALALEGAINAYWAYWERTEQSPSIEERVQTVQRNCLEMMIRTEG